MKQICSSAFVTESIQTSHRFILGQLFKETHGFHLLFVHPGLKLGNRLSLAVRMISRSFTFRIPQAVLVRDSSKAMRRDFSFPARVILLRDFHLRTIKIKRWDLFRRWQNNVSKIHVRYGKHLGQSLPIQVNRIAYLKEERILRESFSIGSA